MCPVNSPNEEKLAYYASPSPMCTVVHRTRSGFWLQCPLPLPHPRPRRGHAVVQSVSDCKKHIVLYYHHCWTFRTGKEPSARFTRVRTVEPPEEAKSQAQGFIGVVVLVGVYYNYSERCYCMMPPRHVYPKLCHLFFLKERVGAHATTTQVARTHNTFTSNKF